MTREECIRDLKAIISMVEEDRGYDDIVDDVEDLFMCLCSYTGFGETDNVQGN